MFLRLDMYAQTLPLSEDVVRNSLIKQPRQKSVFPPNSGSRTVFESRIRLRKCYHFTEIQSGRKDLIEEKAVEGKFDDGYYMRRCVELARKAIGCTSPNPMVGCVIVKDGKIVGEGFHPKAGQPHAEVFALRDAGDLAENGTAYVSLEPCNHYGRTPPCTEALIKAKVRNVVIGMVDPNPVVASTGVKKLQEAGIGVIAGVEEEMCRRLNETYIHYMLTGTPFLTVRYSMSLDGHLLNQLGDDSVECGGYYSKLLQEYDAIMLHSKALVEKSLVPISKEPGANQPVQIVLLKSPNSVTQIPFLNNNDTSKLITISGKDASLVEILQVCKSRGLCSVLLDLTGYDVGSEDILKEGFENKLFQKVVVEVLPVLGGDGDKMSKYVDPKLMVKRLSTCVYGETVVLEGYL